MLDTRETLTSVRINNQTAPYMSTGKFTFQDPQTVGDGDAVTFTDGRYVVGSQKITGKLMLSLGNIIGNVNIVKQLKKTHNYDTLTVYTVDGFGVKRQYLFQGLTRKTPLESQIGNQDSMEYDIEFAYGQDVIIS